CKTIMWSKDTVDWRDKDAAVCLRRATEGVKGGDLILMHPMAHTLQALPAILDYYRAQGLRAITVGENVA
ncbi:MAG: polysaccharide deacetylase, partial [Candidatus Gallimonas sp.]